MNMKQKTIERHLGDIGLAVLLLITIGLGVRAIVLHSRNMQKQPSVDDLHQQQEMIDYHHSHGRNIIVFTSATDHQ